MAEFNFDSLDISRVNNETIAELGEILPLPLLDIRPRRKVTKELTNLYRKATGQLVLK